MNKRVAWLAAMCVVAAWSVRPADAAAPTGELLGLELPTPGGHVVGQLPGLTEKHGCYLRAGTNGGDETRLLVTHLERWQYHTGYLSGLCKRGWFLFDEAKSAVVYFGNEASLDKALAQRSIGPATSDWFTAGGLPALRQRWSERMGSVLQQLIAQCVREMDAGERAAVAARLEVEEAELAGAMYVDLARMLPLYFFYDPHTTPQILAGQPDEVALRASIERSSDAVRASGILPPFIAYLIRAYEKIDFTGPTPAEPNKRYARGVVLDLMARILDQHARLAVRLEREAELRRAGGPKTVKAKVAATESLLQTIRAQLELAQVQHRGAYPDLIADGWRPLTDPTDERYATGTSFGPYLPDAPHNLLAVPGVDPASVAADTTAAWRYDPKTGQLHAVVALTAQQFERMRLSDGDFIRIDPPAEQ